MTEHNDKNTGCPRHHDLGCLSGVGFRKGSRSRVGQDCSGKRQTRSFTSPTRPVGLAVVGGRKIDINRSFRDNGLSGRVEIDWGPEPWSWRSCMKRRARALFEEEVSKIGSEAAGSSRLGSLF